MSASVFRRRQADRLTQLLDQADRLTQLLDQAATSTHGVSTSDTELAGYVRLSGDLVGAAGALPGPTPEFRAGLRAMLVATAERDGVGTTAPDPSPRSLRLPFVTHGRARGAILVGLAAGTLALSGVSAASSNAMPGDPLYRVKRSTESAQLSLANSDSGRGQLYLEFARNRASEAQSMRTGGGPTGMLDDMDAETMLDDVDAETRDGVRLLIQVALDRRDRTRLDVIDTFVHEQRVGLARLGDADRVRQSLALLDQIAQRSARLRANLTCGTGTARTDGLGAVPPICGGNSTQPGIR